ncbi:LacI family DNA-binding transcriptional regulator [Pannonibacter phragmitetus]|uniref:LacI family DNA-binding transcriptional regulator n=1 Tax=Pannonibacter phragmitetus TaxID=121719 RepID=UPI003D2F070F
MEKKTPGKVGIKDVSQEAGVALSTVSHVLNGTAPISAEVRARVLDAARRLGYLAKRQQRGRLPRSPRSTSRCPMPICRM